MFEGKLPNLGGGVSNSSFQGEEGAAARILSRLDLDIPCPAPNKATGCYIVPKIFVTPLGGLLPHRWVHCEMSERKLPSLGGGVSYLGFWHEEAAGILSRLDLDIPRESTDKFCTVISLEPTLRISPSSPNQIRGHPKPGMPAGAIAELFHLKFTEAPVKCSSKSCQIGLADILLGFASRKQMLEDGLGLDARRPQRFRILERLQIPEIYFARWYTRFVPFLGVRPGCGLTPPNGPYPRPGTDPEPASRDEEPKLYDRLIGSHMYPPRRIRHSATVGDLTRTGSERSSMALSISPDQYQSHHGQSPWLDSEDITYHPTSTGHIIWSGSSPSLPVFPLVSDRPVVYKDSGSRKRIPVLQLKVIGHDDSIFETAQTGLFFGASYELLINGFGQFEPNTNVPWEAKAQLGAPTLSTFFAQEYFAHIVHGWAHYHPIKRIMVALFAIYKRRVIYPLFMGLLGVASLDECQDGTHWFIHEKLEIRNSKPPD
ncbi:hypothetical protein B0H13DRAFT_1912869 [Mycena leptocephala]|nr:hypothetical protein B0H13DRAFT_1912869 [Mycena leptocephala]